MALKNLRGKQVLVTGAGAGIGRATALAFAKRGANLVVSDINPARLAEVQQEIDALGVSSFAHAADVSDDKAMHAFARAVHARVGAVDVLVNDAGIGYVGPFLASPLDSWKRLLDVNVMGVVHGCCFFVPKMIAAGGPRQVVNVASAAALAPPPNTAAYAASKYAVMGLSEVLAMELHRTSVRVTTVCPGIVNTDITGSTNVSAAIPAAQLARLQAYCKAKGCTPDFVGERIVRAVRDRRDLLLVGPMARQAYHAKRVSRKLLRNLTINSARKSGFAF